jgi:hypothetical protein
MTEPTGAAAEAPDPRAVTEDSEATAALRQAAADLLGVPVAELPPLPDVLAAVTGLTAPAPPLTPEQVEAAAQGHAEQALADYDQSMAAADEEEARGHACLDHAEAMRAKAEADRDRGLANAARIRSGDPLEPPPESAGPGEPGGPTTFGDVTAQGGEA